MVQQHSVGKTIYYEGVKSVPRPAPPVGEGAGLGMQMSRGLCFCSVNGFQGRPMKGDNPQSGEEGRHQRRRPRGSPTPGPEATWRAREHPGSEERGQDERVCSPCAPDPVSPESCPNTRLAPRSDGDVSSNLHRHRGLCGDPPSDGVSFHSPRPGAKPR